MASIYKKTLSIVFLLLIIIVASLYSSIIVEGYISDNLKEQIVQFFPQKYYNGTPFEMELYKKKYVIPEEFRGKIQSVSIPDMYALYVYSNDSFTGTYAKLVGNVPDIDAVLRKTPGWTGSIVGVKIIGEFIRIYEKPEFKGRNVGLLSSQGYVLFTLGPQNAQQASSYKRGDGMSFRVPKGLIVIVTTITDDGTTEQKQYSGGNYPTTAIPDTQGTKLVILREP